MYIICKNELHYQAGVTQHPIATHTHTQHCSVWRVEWGCGRIAAAPYSRVQGVTTRKN